MAFVANAAVDYGSAFGHTTGIPPYRQFFGGGPDNVRGYRESFLGPKDQFGNPYGGNMRITSQNELIFPMPAKWRSSARVSAFFDMGGVYQTGTKLKFYGPDQITPQSYQLENWSDIRRSVGIAVQWLAPLGLFRFSLGIPLNAHKGDPTFQTRYGDSTEVFQFSIGQAF
jgi:outer membrane protein insertion porin family